MSKDSLTTGRFGSYGGMFVPELLIQPLKEVAEAFERFKKDKQAQAELQRLLLTFAGRPTPLYHARTLSDELGFQLYLKREDLLHGGAHKTNNTLGQGLLAQFMGKRKLIAETGAGQHGVAVAMIGALLNMPVTVFMGERDIKRQQPNVKRMQLFGADVVSVTGGSKTLKDAINEALRYYVAHSTETFYVFGTAAGPHPYPTIVRQFQEVIGREARRQILEQTNRLPKKVIACVGGGSNAIGIFSGFLADSEVELIGVEPAGGAPLNYGQPAILHGALSYALQDRHGNISESESIAAGLDYPGVGPEHSALKDAARAEYVTVTDAAALSAFHQLCTKEGIIPALESSHALAHAVSLKGKLKKTDLVIVNLSGRGDKDIDQLPPLTTHP
ncbi:tryptophan synthase subunit beta [Candidatus Peregrinibacteria bacterium CG_4_9_14_0_2_um_filter_53_11]|nr:MAG: tryptophan synthase subunit beta [Candidatus Peregrinibacteria bacterium CG_4_9_14_0_2_um_filter_53_11]